MNIASKLQNIAVASGEIAIVSLTQAGFWLKTSVGTTLAIDPYLTDCCERMFGFVRQIPAVITPETLDVDLMISTHSHADHLDPDAFPIFAKNPKMRFIGAADCVEGYTAAGIDASRYSLMSEDRDTPFRDLTIRAVYADHGDLAPQAKGVLICVDGLTIYDTGDTAYQPEKILASLNGAAIDVLMAPINGAFGNLDAQHACRLAETLQPKVFIGCHYGMFKEHGGDVPGFLECCKTLLNTISAMVLAGGEGVVYSHCATRRI
jgi:L-ascorbate 6-phosphate lactonase